MLHKFVRLCQPLGPASQDSTVQVVHYLKKCIKWIGAHHHVWKQLHGHNMSEGMQESPGSHSALLTPHLSSFAVPATPGKSEGPITRRRRNEQSESCASSLT